MARHPASRRVHRRPSAPDDRFVEGVLESTAWAKTHARTLIIGGITVILLAVALLWWRTSRSALAESATTRLTTLRQTVQTGNPAVAIRDLEAFLQNFGSTAAADEARLLLASAQLEAGQPQPAVETVQELAVDLDQPMGPPAAFLLGAAYEALNQFDRAEEVYLRVGNDARFDYQQRQGIEHAARVRLENGNPAGAAELYDRLIAMLPDASPERAVFEMRRAEAQALAARPSAEG
jgi:predicted negative regulator of RcsB-dependent stress response